MPLVNDADFFPHIDRSCSVPNFLDYLIGIFYPDGHSGHLVLSAPSKEFIRCYWMRREKYGINHVIYFPKDKTQFDLLLPLVELGVM